MRLARRDALQLSSTQDALLTDLLGVLHRCGAMLASPRAVAEMTRTKLAVVWIALCAGCASDRKDVVPQIAEEGRSPWHFADLGVPRLASPPLREISLTEVARFGSAEGEEWLSNVGFIAVSDRVLAISTPKTCEFVVFSRSSRKVLFRFGKCGQGPDEFDRPSAIALNSDTLIVTDRRGTRVRWLSLEGYNIREHRIERRLTPSGERWTFVEPLGDSGVLLGAALDSHDRRGGQAILSDPTGYYLRAWLPDLDKPVVAVFRDGSGVAAENSGYERTSTFCAGRFSSGARHVTAWNDWTDQTVSLDLDTLAAGRVRVLQNTSGGLVERSATWDDYMPPRIAPNGLVDAACGRPHTMSNHRWWRRGSSMQGRPTDGRLTVYDDGVPLGTLSIDQKSPVLMTRLLGAYNDSFFFGSSVDFEYPLVIEMKLRVAPGVLR